MRPITFLLAFLLLASVSHATHLKGGYIRIERVSGLTYRISVTAIVVAGSSVMFGGEGDVLSFGDGTSVIVPETLPEMIGNGLAFAHYETLHAYSAASFYVVTYGEPNRNAGIVNLANSVNTPMYLESGFNADPFVSFEASPQLETWPVFSAMMGTPFSYSITASDPDDNMLFYTVVEPGNAEGYTLPENFEINPVNGLITWDTRYNNEFLAGEYLFDVRINQFKNDVFVGYVTVDFQITLEEPASSPTIGQRIELDENQRLYVPASSQKQIRVFYGDDATAYMSVHVFSEIGHLIDFETYDSTAGNRNFLNGIITIDPAQLPSRYNPYIVTVRGASSATPDGAVFSKDLVFMIYTQDVDIAEIILDAENFASRPRVQTFPNPCIDELLFSGIKPGERVIVRTIDNLLVHDDLYKAGTAVDVRRYPSGMFIYQVHTPAGVITGKAVKK